MNQRRVYSNGSNRQVPALVPNIFCVEQTEDGCLNFKGNLCLNPECTAPIHISEVAFNEFLNEQPTTREEVVAQAKAQMKLNKMNSATTRSDNVSAKGTMKEPGDRRVSPEKPEEKRSSSMKMAAPKGKKEELCHFVNTTSGCRNGPECEYFHPRKPCENIKKLGECKYGCKCRFAHFILEESN